MILNINKKDYHTNEGLKTAWIRATRKHNVIYYLLWIICRLIGKIQVCLWVYGYVDLIECIFAQSQSSTVLRCPRGETLGRLCKMYSTASTTIPQHDQGGLPGCPLWPCPQPRNPAESANTQKFILGENRLSKNNKFQNWPGTVPVQPQRASLSPPLEQKEQQSNMP